MGDLKDSELKNCKDCFTWGKEALNAVLLALYSSVIFRSNSTLLSLSTWLPLAPRRCCWWAISGNVTCTLFFRLLIGQLIFTVRAYVPPLSLACAWRRLTACIYGCMRMRLFYSEFYFILVPQNCIYKNCHVPCVAKAWNSIGQSKTMNIFLAGVLGVRIIF